MENIKTPVIPWSINSELVYEPAEDSFLLIDALERDLQLIKVLNPLMCLEIGTGSGIIITALAMALKNHCPSCFFGIDLNPAACQMSKKISMMNKTDVEMVQMDLTQSLSNETQFDIIIFNPPYVVTETAELSDDRLVTKAWAGGINGREIMDRLFPHISKLLSTNGFFYLLVIKENKPREILEIFKTYRINGTIVIERKIRGEHLYVLRFCRRDMDFSL